MWAVRDMILCNRRCFYRVNFLLGCNLSNPFKWCDINKIFPWWWKSPFELVNLLCFMTREWEGTWLSLIIKPFLSVGLTEVFITGKEVKLQLQAQAEEGGAKIELPRNYIQVMLGIFSLSENKGEHKNHQGGRSFNLADEARTSFSYTFSYSLIWFRMIA